ncbi:luciferase family oxidoreductase group 1 [Rhizobium aquaticum]|uniref:Luciferase family oxidoreductase group 1 n=1 Tax=Rhizobium aquaticum TaxID=1549636 RepID=A0ABV2J5P6_9HYPH
MSRPIPLSVLDFAVIGTGQSEAAALNQSVELARHAEALGYQRFWTSEHHNMASVASTAPDLIAMRIADRTTYIKVGAGGVMLPNHAPFSVAERYLTLEAFHPDRIDLGVGRAPGTDGVAAHALRRSDAAHYAQQLAELDCFLHDGFPANHPYAQISAMPKGASRPKLIVLGSSLASAQLAAAQGYPFGFAGHFSLQLAASAIRAYKQHFVPGATASPYAILAANVVAADTQEKAEWVARSGKLGYIRHARGMLGPLPSPEEAAEHPWIQEEIAAADAFSADHIVGDGTSVGQKLRALVRETGADELMINATIHGFEDHKRSLEIIADVIAAERVAMRA